jgi:hypothetical protein
MLKRWRQRIETRLDTAQMETIICHDCRKARFVQRRDVPTMRFDRAARAIST